MTDRPLLSALADRFGILPSYFDISGVEHVTTDETRAILLAASGFDVSSEDAAGRAIATLDSDERGRLLPPVRVCVTANLPSTVELTLPEEASGGLAWDVELRTEDGETCRSSGREEVTEGTGRIKIPIPRDLPIGYHILNVGLEYSADRIEAEQSLIVSPGCCPAVTQITGRAQSYGLWANLYALESRRNLGIGDMTDLKELVRFAGDHGAAFVGINPLHAVYNRGDQQSPYCPLSRVYRNFLYLDVERVPEFAVCPGAQDLVATDSFREELRDVRGLRLIDYDRVLTLKLEVLRLLHGTFLEQHTGHGTERGRAYTAFVNQQGDSLSIFATFMALSEWLRCSKRWVGTQKDWRDWPEPYQAPDTPEVKAFCEANPTELGFHRYLQFELDRQLGEVAAEARACGMAMGLYNDLAIGAAAEGSDAWSFPDLFVRGVQVGAPPDPYSDTGQTWGFPPIHPLRLRETRYQYWTDVLRSAMDHAGMLRIDHVMGLFRQFWVPEGKSAATGAYVAYPADDLLGILALESQRHGALVVGEDLGTVPPEVPPALAEREILSSRVVYFERDSAGEFRPSESYSHRALVTVTTHDHPPLSGFWGSRDLQIRDEIGLFETSDDLARAHAGRCADRAALLRRLVAEGCLSGPENISAEMICEAVHRFLARTPAPLLGVSLDDLAGETDPVNIPGLAFDRYPNWSRRMTRSLEDLVGDERVGRILDELHATLSD